MATSGHEQKNRFKQIFADGWEEFKRTHPRYAAVDEVVQKMLGCGDPANGHAVYLCPDCQARHVVAFSCKSQFCAKVCQSVQSALGRDGASDAASRPDLSPSHPHRA